MKKLRDLLPFISYDAQLQLMETERGSKEYEYLFNKTELIRRDVIEKCYTELLDRELSDGVHGEGIRDGLYIHLYKEETNEEDEDYEEYCPSSTNGDYSPSNPWDAPGMSIKDFI